MRTFRTEGIVIKRRNSGEADRIVTVLTPNSGKIYIKAVGVRRIPSRRSSHVELLNHSFLTLYKGKQYPILTEAQTIEHFLNIKEDLTKVGFGYHLCELIDGLCPEGQEQRSVFFLLKNTLKRLEQEDNIVFTIHEFEVELLTLLGFWSSQHPEQNTNYVIENILERKLKSKYFFSKLQ